MAHGIDVLALRDVNIPVGGFVRALGHQAELIPVLWAGATPAAHVDKDAYEKITGEIIRAAETQDFDGIYLDLHGAMVCEHLDDGEGALLSRLRTIVGPRIPIVASLDLHANVTVEMLAKADALVAYRTYPHEDMAETGERAAYLMKRLMMRGKAFYRASRPIPFLIPTIAMCTMIDPARRVYDLLESLESNEGVALSFTPGFPAADFQECGAVVWGYGDDDRISAVVEELSTRITEWEADWEAPLLQPEEAVRTAMAIAEGASRPVVIADTQDNPGGGGDSNTTGMLKALVNCKAKGAAIGLIVDPDAAAAAHAAGVGADLNLALGGQSGVPGDSPYHATFRVEQLSDGRCRYDGPMMHGRLTDVGPSARLSIDDVQIVVSTYKDQMLDRNLYRMAGVQPEHMKILVNKSSVHFRADFQPIAEAVLVAKAPGPHLADPAEYPWKRLREGLRLRPLGQPFKAPQHMRMR